MSSNILELASSHLHLIPALCLAFTAGLVVPARGADQPASLGVFDQHGDIGGVAIPGNAAFDAASQEYIVASSGTNMWGEHDEYHFAWKRLKGDFIIQAFTQFLGEGIDPHRKMGLIVR